VSVVRGVGHAASFSRTDMGKFGEFLLPCDVPRAFESDAVGEGHPAISRGENEDPLALVRGADFSRAEYSPRHIVTHFFQVADDCGESQRDVSFDVLEEAQSWFTKSNAICDPGPEVSFVFFSLSLSCCGERLAVVDDGPVGVVTLVLVDGDVVYIGNSAWLVVSDVLPAVVSLNLSGSISVRNRKYILGSLIDSSALNDCFGFDFLLSD